MNKIIIIIAICILGVNQAFAHGDFYKGSKRGWFWFEQLEVVLNQLIAGK